MADGDLVTLTEYPAGSVVPVGPFQPGWNLVAPVNYTLFFYSAITGAASIGGIIFPGFVAGASDYGPPALIMLQNYTGSPPTTPSIGRFRARDARAARPEQRAGIRVGRAPRSRRLPSS